MRHLPRVLAQVAVLAWLAVSGVHLYLLVLDVQPPWVYSRDFVQEYLLVRAVADGMDPYVPIRELAERYGVAAGYGLKEHPTPHPPTIGLLLLPLALLDFPAAAAVWLGGQLALLVASLFLLARGAGLPRPLALSFLLTALLVPWHALLSELDLGQLTLPLLLFTVGALAAHAAGRGALAGALIGLAVLTKLLPALFLLPFLVRRDWRAVGAALAVALAGYGVVLALVGPAPLARYFTQVLPGLSLAFRTVASNISTWTLGPRLFQGVSRSGEAELLAAPWIHLPAAGTILAPLVPGAILLLTVLWLVWQRHGSLERSLALVVPVSLLVSPISWEVYLLLGLIPGAYVARVLRERALPLVPSLLALLAVALAVVPLDAWYLLGGPTLSLTGPPSGAAPLSLTMVLPAPTLALGLLALLVAWLPPPRARPSGA